MTGPGYPLRYVNERTLPGDHAGPVHVWDIDKTYLDTDLSGLGGFLRIPLEMAIDKRTVPGTVAVLRECRRGPGKRPAHVPLYFVSASPPQLESVLRRRMLLDGVEPDGFVFKDQLALALQRDLGALRSQVEYKLTAHWLLIADLPPGARLLLVGDDWESDALVFARLTAAQAGAYSSGALERVLRASGVPPRRVPRLCALAERAAGRARVEAAFVIRARRRPLESLVEFEPAVRAVDEALQLAAVLHARGVIGASGVARVAADLAANAGWTRERLGRSLDAAAGRWLIDAGVAARLREVVAG